MVRDALILSWYWLLGEKWCCLEINRHLSYHPAFSSEYKSIKMTLENCLKSSRVPLDSASSPPSTPLHSLLFDSSNNYKCNNSSEGNDRGATLAFLARYLLVRLNFNLNPSTKASTVLYISTLPTESEPLYHRVGEQFEQGWLTVIRPNIATASSQQCSHTNTPPCRALPLNRPQSVRRATRQKHWGSSLLISLPGESIQRLEHWSHDWH